MAAPGDDPLEDVRQDAGQTMLPSDEHPSREEEGTEEDGSDEEPQERGLMTYLGLANLIPDIMSIQMCARERQKDVPGLPVPPSEPTEEEAGKVDDRKLLHLIPRGARLVTDQERALSTLPPMDTIAASEATEDAGNTIADTAWQWPAWALESNEPCIEVFVEDKASGTSRWSRAVPVDSVMDSAGNDELLTAHYEWDEEVYEQDFGPEHVRRLGSKETVQDMIASGKLTEQQATKSSQSFNSQAVKAQMASFASNASSTMQVIKEHLLHMTGGPIKGQYRGSNNTAGYRPPLPAQGIGEPENIDADAAPDSTFRWPDYALEYDTVAIEVYVEDEKRVGRWLAAMPKNRVVGPQGEDVFLSAEYDLQGSAYVQEFEPQHVRRLGSTQPIQPPD